MSELKETREKQPDNLSEVKGPNIAESDRPKLTRNADWKEFNDNPFTRNTDVYDDIFKKKGLVYETSGNNEAEMNNDSNESETDYSQYLEKGDDGKYYDKETGKAYDSIDAWVKAQETLIKRYESTADFYENKAKKEWARFKNAEANGESEAEKWEHYRNSQEYYAKAKECKEKAKHLREKLGRT